MHHSLFAAALGLSEPWYVKGLSFDEDGKRLTIEVDFRPGSRFAHGGGAHPVHDTRTKRYRHLNFFQHECVLEARVPRVRLPDGGVALVTPPWAGRLSGFSLLFEALVMSLCREMPFAAVSRLTGLSWHRVVAICARRTRRVRARAGPVPKRVAGQFEVPKRGEARLCDQAANATV